MPSSLFSILPNGLNYQIYLLIQASGVSMLENLTNRSTKPPDALAPTAIKCVCHCVRAKLESRLRKASEVSTASLVSRLTGPRGTSNARARNAGFEPDEAPAQRLPKARRAPRGFPSRSAASTMSRPTPSPKRKMQRHTQHSRAPSGTRCPTTVSVARPSGPLAGLGLRRPLPRREICWALRWAMITRQDCLRMMIYFRPHPRVPDYLDGKATRGKLISPGMHQRSQR
jgi:hypothetical protein